MNGDFRAANDETSLEKDITAVVHATFAID